MLPGNLCLILYKETKETKYKGCAESIRKVFDTYPRTKDGGFWHANTKSREWQLWADGVFMGMPFLVQVRKDVRRRKVRERRSGQSRCWSITRT
jgi:unsaturated rhamnogalacturonyl hydrolase